MIRERLFLERGRPALHAAVDELRRRYAGRDGRGGALWDMEHVLVVVPGRRASRRLLHLLAAAAAEHRLLLAPPTIVTPGRLPEELVDLHASSRAPLASGCARLAAWVAALRAADPARLAALFPARGVQPAQPVQPTGPVQPAEPTLAGDLALARDLARVRDDLAAAGHRVADVPRVAGDELSEPARWHVLAELDAAYERALADAGLADWQIVRRDALARGGPWRARDVVLLAVPDLTKQAQQMLRAASGQVDVLALVDADAARYDAGFDDLGVVVPGFWGESEAARVDLRPEQLVVADRPRDEAGAIVRWLAQLSEQRPLAPDDVTIGLGDAALAPQLARALELAGMPARLATGRPVVHSAPSTLLRGLAEYLEDPSAEAFAALVRHPDLPLADPGAIATLDDVRARHLPARVEPPFAPAVKDEPAVSLAALHAEVLALVGPLRGPQRTLLAWIEPVAGVLAQVYAGRDLRRGRAEDEPLIHALRALGDLLDEWGKLPPGLAPAAEIGAGEALRIVLGGLGGEFVPEPAGEGAVEILGWLEVALDDAPILAVTGLNDGAIPDTVRADALLPEPLRRRLGVVDNGQRFARDAARLAALLEGRPHVRLVCARRTSEGDPLNPSRLLFAADPDTVVQRVERFFGGSDPDMGASLAVLPPHGDASAFRLPAVTTPRRKVREDAFEVSWFRAYLRCPYRFALGDLDLPDEPVELAASDFGSLAHRVLESFGKSPFAATADAGAIADYLARELERQVAYRFGPGRLPVVTLQAAQLRRRLERFAAWHAGQVLEGWRTDPERVEAKLTAPLEVDGATITVVGRIDRIDVHEDGRVRVIDYKTSDAAKAPDETHRAKVRGVRQWTDLQLPLYRRLAAAAGLDPASVELAHLALAARGVEYLPASWGADDLASADDAARDVVRRIRRGEFAPALPGGRTDAFSRLTGDRCTDRARYLEQPLEAGR